MASIFNVPAMNKKVKRFGGCMTGFPDSPFSPSPEISPSHATPSPAFLPQKAPALSNVSNRASGIAVSPRASPRMQRRGHCDGGSGEGDHAAPPPSSRPKPSSAFSKVKSDEKSNFPSAQANASSPALDGEWAGIADATMHAPRQAAHDPCGRGRERECTTQSHSGHSLPHGPTPASSQAHSVSSPAQSDSQRSQRPRGPSPTNLMRFTQEMFQLHYGSSSAFHDKQGLSAFVEPQQPQPIAQRPTAQQETSCQVDQIVVLQRPLPSPQQAPLADQPCGHSQPKGASLAC